MIKTKRTSGNVIRGSDSAEPGHKFAIFSKGMTLVQENEELLPHHTIVLETEWEIGTQYRLDCPQKNQNGGHHDIFYWR